MKKGWVPSCRLLPSTERSLDVFKKINKFIFLKSMFLEKDKCMLSLICGILKKGTHELIYKTEINRDTDVENKLTVSG